MSVVLAALELARTYRTPAGDVAALRAFTHRFEAGRVTAVAGPSGSGKSTLLNLLAGFDRPDEGRVEVDGTSLGSLPERERARLRLRRFGFVFQASNLISVLPAERNVAFPMGLAGVDRAERRRRARELLGRFGVEHRAHALPDRLSGGERQRVALARALANDPDVVFADEPTGNLDRASGTEVVAALRDVAQDGRTVIVVSHDPTVADAADVRLRLVDGRLAEPAAGTAPAPTDAAPRQEAHRR
jgi:putative ABC transport system ATP-binding protein